MCSSDLTEVLAHLVEEAYAGDLADAVRAALRQVEGAYGIVVMHRRELSRLVGARQDIPLVVGLNGEESFIASDVTAILGHTNRIVFLEEGDGAVAGVRQNHQTVGALAVEILAGQLQHNKYGLPEVPTTTFVEGTWFDGRTCPPRG